MTVSRVVVRAAVAAAVGATVLVALRATVAAATPVPPSVRADASAGTPDPAEPRLRALAGRLAGADPGQPGDRGGPAGRPLDRCPQWAAWLSEHRLPADLPARSLTTVVLDR